MCTWGRVWSDCGCAHGGVSGVIVGVHMGGVSGVIVGVHMGACLE